MDKPVFKLKGRQVFLFKHNGLLIVFLPVLIEQPAFFLHPVKKACAWKWCQYTHKGKQQIVFIYKVCQPLKCFFCVIIMPDNKRTLDEYSVRLYLLYCLAEILRQIYPLVHLPEIIFGNGFKTYKDPAAPALCHQLQHLIVLCHIQACLARPAYVVRNQFLEKGLCIFSVRDNIIICKKYRPFTFVYAVPLGFFYVAYYLVNGTMPYRCSVKGVDRAEFAEKRASLCCLDNVEQIFIILQKPAVGSGAF